MLFRSTTPIVTTAAFLFPHVSFSAVVHIEAGIDTQLLKARTGTADTVELLPHVATNVVRDTQADKDSRSRFTQELVDELHANLSQFNWVVCHPNHDYTWDGQRGVDWDHFHTEFPIQFGLTIGYEIYYAKSGHFVRHGDGGFLNWAYYGNVLAVQNDGSDVTFGVP
ncbi:hypothetical protein PLEOSDRAFT_1107571 [Pleurotus ostreatus PC15]|uniref:DUF7888 domain-containing protein n=1 Tax=Pleurotus ostreatus (strain PC15) TaxID=1137138 RepID=A0A067N9W4_PLEO1|nr:hypothetical protein PLEOSDRAFT_1107571 [Pleurotus ostreatus PC15]